MAAVEDQAENAAEVASATRQGIDGAPSLASLAAKAVVASGADPKDLADDGYPGKAVAAVAQVLEANKDADHGTAADGAVKTDAKTADAQDVGTLADGLAELFVRSRSDHRCA